MYFFSLSSKRSVATLYQGWLGSGDDIIGSVTVGLFFMQVGQCLTNSSMSFKEPGHQTAAVSYTDDTVRYLGGHGGSSTC